MYANGTARIEELTYLPCQCPICLSYTVKELRELPKELRMLEVAKHNLHVLKAEVLQNQELKASAVGKFLETPRTTTTEGGRGTQ